MLLELLWVGIVGFCSFCYIFLADCVCFWCSAEFLVNRSFCFRTCERKSSAEV